MPDHSLRGALEMLDAEEGFMLLQEESDEGKSTAVSVGFLPRGRSN